MYRLRQCEGGGPFLWFECCRGQDIHGHTAIPKPGVFKQSPSMHGQHSRAPNALRKGARNRLSTYDTICAMQLKLPKVYSNQGPVLLGNFVRC